MVRKPIDQANKILQEAGSGNIPPKSPQRAAGPGDNSPAIVAPTQPPPTLILCTGGRWVTVYNQLKIDYQFINVPDIRGSEAKIEQLIESVLGKRYADQFWPGYIRGQFEVERLTAADIADRVAKIEFYDRLALSRSDRDRPTNLEMLRAAMGAAR